CTRAARTASRCFAYRERDVPTGVHTRELLASIRGFSASSLTAKRGVDPVEQLADLLAGQAVLLLLLLLQALQIVRQVQRGHDGDAFRADDFAAQANLAHFSVEEARGAFQAGAG